MCQTETPSSRRFRVWMKASEADGPTFTAEGFGPTIGAANQHAFEQIEAMVNNTLPAVPAE